MVGIKFQMEFTIDVQLKNCFYILEIENGLSIQSGILKIIQFVCLFV